MVPNFSKIKYFSKFKFGSSHILLNTLTQFFNASITFSESSIDKIFSQFNSSNINPSNVEKQKVYVLDENQILLLPRIYVEKEEIAFFGIFIKKDGIGKKGLDFKIYNTIESTITRNLSLAYYDKFENSIQLFDDNLIKRTIALYFCKGYYHPSRVIFLIDYFNKLRTTSFEGEFFSTGMILTRSDEKYSTEKPNHQGITTTLTKSINISKNDIDRRFWYLVDGKSNFFLCNRQHYINKFFTLDYNQTNGKNYLSKILLEETIKGGDVLFRVENEKEFSIITSNGKEFVYSENHWKYREYKLFKDLIQSKVSVSDEVFEYLLFYILYCSKNRISSIIWIPEDINNIDPYLKSKNRLLRREIDICDLSYSNLIIRYLSSDGATIIDTEGKIAYYGCIIDMTSVKIKGVKGTGESAAGVLSENGLSVKISQDGTIKLFKIKNRKPILF